MPLSRPKRHRSLGFIEHENRSWSCFLVSGQVADGRWRGYLVFRPADAASEADEVATAEIFLEGDEEAVQERTRLLGRPLLRALLASALDVRERTRGERPELRRWLRERLAADAQRLADEGGGAEARDPARLRSLYASYRLDQLVHLLALVPSEDFDRVVEQILEGSRVDFASDDRLQLAMLVVDRLEGLLPLPPFEVWVEDFLAHRERYRLYAETLHRAGRLP